MKLNKTENELKAWLDGTITEYDILTDAEFNSIYAKNAANGYGISREELLKLGKQHEKARSNFDIKTMAKIECRLTDINFHSECGMLSRGEYARFDKRVNEEW